MLKHTGRGSALVAVIIAICILSVRDLSQDLRLGIDLQGGTELLYRIDLDLVPAASQDSASEDFKRIISNRLDRFGLKELSIAPVGRDRLLIQLPGADRAELERMKRQVEDAGELSFHLVSDDEYQTPEVIAGIEEEMKAYEEDLRRYNIDQRKPAAEREGLSLPQPLVRLAVVGRVERDPTDTGPPPTPPKHVVENGPSLKVSGDELTNASPTIDRFGTPAVGFEFSGKGAAIFSDLTGNNVGKSLAIVLDGVAQSVATIQSRINGPGQLTGSFTDTQVRDIVTILKAGSLPVKPELVHEQTIGAVLGRDSVERGTQAMLIAFVLVVLFMFAYYLVPGIVANIALFLNLLLLLACMVAFRNTLTFPGMAGLLLTVGMAVDANILIFERIREEKARGRALRKAVEVGYQRAFWTIFDANLTTLITAYILFQFGTGAIKGFAVVLSIGIIASFFTALYVSRLVISLLLKSGLVKELRMLRLFEKPNIDFLQHRKVFTSTSVGLIILGLGFLVVRGQESLGIDFTGGARIIAKLQTPATEVQIRDLIRGISGPDGKAMFADVQIQSIEEEVEGGARKARAFSIRTRQIGSQAQAGAARAQGPGTGGSPTEVFKARVEETLRGAGLLAPAPFIDSQITGGSESENGAEGKVLAVTAYLRKELDGPSPLEVKTALLEHGYPVDRVEQLPAGSASDSYLPFRITTLPSTEDTGSVYDLEERLQGVISGLKVFELSDPFPEVNTIGSRVAQDMQGKVFVAMMIAFGAIVFYISLRFQLKFGLAAIVALVHDIFFTLGMMAIADTLLGGAMSLKINLPVVAALLTVVGYSLNDTIVIFDRIRENIAGKKRGFDYVREVNESINQTLSRTLLTSLTTFTVVLILLIWGGEAIEAFSFALCVGVLVGTYSSIYVASPALIHFNARAEKRRAEMLAEAGSR